MPNIHILKANGESEKFSSDKVITSLRRSGASNKEIKQILKEVYPNIRDGMRTKDLYQMVYHSLAKLEGRGKYVATRYSLKKAISELGPTGFPFEQLVAGVLTKLGYKTETNLVLQGECVGHEIDISALKENDKYMIEAKFHKKMGYKTDIKTALYVYARFLDLQKQFSIPWIFTNTKVTSEVTKYALCKNIKVTSWDYPKGEGLRDLIDKAHLHPITSLSELDSMTKQNLLDHNVIFIKDLPKAEFLFKNQQRYRDICKIAEEFDKTHVHSTEE